MRVIIVAAGTGGHITPGISIANKIMKENPDAEILFIGTKGGMENDLLKKEGYTNIAHIRADGIRREITLDNLKRAFNIILGITDAKKIIKEFKPDIVIGTGGYVCYPVFKVATSMKIPTMLHESNSIPGKVVIAMAKKVDTIMVGFEAAAEKIKGAKNVVYTGTPTKMASYIPPDNLKETLGLKDLPVVLITGGSQGAKKLNDYLVDIIANEAEKPYQMVFVTGPKNYDAVIAELARRHCGDDCLKNVLVLPYVYNMEEYMSVADLIIARAGALSLTEICLMGIPSILVPFPAAAENHQLYNAKMLEKAGAAIVIQEKEMNSYEKLRDILNDTISNKDKLLEMKRAAKKMAVLNVDDRIYVEIKKLLRGKI